MKCPVCWAEKAYVRDVRGWRRILLACLLTVPMKCHHCFHKFHVPWFLTIGKTLVPPAAPPPKQRPRGTSQAAKHHAERCQ